MTAAQDLLESLIISHLAKASGANVLFSKLYADKSIRAQCDVVRDVKFPTRDPYYLLNDSCSQIQIILDDFGKANYT